MTTRLKIDLVQGILEVEGSEFFVKTIYQDFKAQFLGEKAVEDEPKPPKRRRSRRAKTAAKTAPPPGQVPEAVVPKVEELPVAPEPIPEAKPPVPTVAYDFLKDLDLSATSDHPSLVEFMDSKFPITNEERNLVFSYYLQHVIKEKPISADHIYTCYRKAKIRSPLDLTHSLNTTANHRKWIKLAKNGHITVTAEGQRYLEEQLPKKIKG